MSRLDGAGGSSAILIRHFLQVPWPPQVESMAMPFQLAASNTVTPCGTRTAPVIEDQIDPNGLGYRRRPPSSRGSLAPAPGCLGGLLLRPVWRGPVRGDPGWRPTRRGSSTRSAALTARTICGARASMIALVSPG